VVDYSFSSIVSHKFLCSDKKDGGDVVLYPSVASEKKGNNFAFHPDVVNKNSKGKPKMGLKAVLKLQLSKENSITKISLLDIGIGNSDEKVEWGKINNYPNLYDEIKVMENYINNINKK
jgi:hypothetical protein